MKVICWCCYCSLLGATATRWSSYSCLIGATATRWCCYCLILATATRWSYYCTLIGQTATRWSCCCIRATPEPEASSNDRITIAFMIAINDERSHMWEEEWQKHN